MKLKNFAPLFVIFILFINMSFTLDEKEPKLKKIFNGKNLDGWKVRANA